jgi:hypothetical protein
MKEEILEQPNKELMMANVAQTALQLEQNISSQ